MTYQKFSRASVKRQGKACRVGPLIVDTITPICQQNGFIQARILLEWEYIVTPQFAQFCTPLKVTFPSKHRHNGRLLLRASSSMAMELSYLEPLILSRVNQYFGYQAISKISLFQGPISKKVNPKKRISPLLSEADQSNLKTSVQSVEDDHLREALFSLGKGICGERPNT